MKRRSFLELLAAAPIAAAGWRPSRQLPTSNLVAVPLTYYPREPEPGSRFIVLRVVRLDGSIELLPVRYWPRDVVNDGPAWTLGPPSRRRATRPKPATLR